MRNTKKGFTLVELLVVIAILAILATVSVVGYTSFIDRANNSNAETELHQIQSYINADLMVDGVWEYDLNETTTVKVVKNADGTLSVVSGASDVADAINKCPDFAGLEGTVSLEGGNLVYTGKDGKGTATWAGVVAKVVLATFEFGTDDETKTSSNDSKVAKTSYEEIDGEYKLSVTGTYMYQPGYVNGQACLKLGSSSEKGTLSFAVNSNVTKVVLYITMYGEDATKVTINGTVYALATSSDDGEFQKIEISALTPDAEWNVEISAVNKTNERYYINTIEFIGYAE